MRNVAAIERGQACQGLSTGRDNITVSVALAPARRAMSARRQVWLRSSAMWFVGRWRCAVAVTAAPSHQIPTPSEPG
jgi:hypothetical protein